MLPVVKFLAEMEAIEPVVRPVLISKIRPVVLTEDEATILKMMPEVKALSEMEAMTPVAVVSPISNLVASILPPAPRPSCE